jgi:2-polyprenyl-3-methyl-5-hydroxy-6-metoxy-1,4-benzoquinol methylase
MLCEIHDPRTRELLLKAGLNAGHRYVEFGCGLGYVARWAASQAAHVTALDLSEEHLGEARRLGAAANLQNMVWINASIYQHELPENSFDYAYARWIFVHLNRPVAAMRRVLEALKPGGIVVCEEPDLSAIYSEPVSEAYHRYRDLAVAAGENRCVDYAGGRRLHCWAQAAGFEILDIGAYQLHYLTGPHKSFWSWSFLESGADLIAEKMLSHDQLNQMKEDMRAADEDPKVLIGHCRNHQLIARKPL